jgi:VanZ family protein
MLLIFLLSAQAAEQSSQLSNGITESIIAVIGKLIPTGFTAENMNHIVRKCAHFFAYFVLGILTANALRSSGLRGFRLIAAALLVCVLYAVSDEIHQLFVPGRGCQATDVLIDSAGALIGTVIVGSLSGKGMRRKVKAQHE